MGVSEAQLSRRLAALASGEALAMTAEAIASALSVDLPLGERDARILGAFAAKFGCEFVYDKFGRHDPLFRRRATEWQGAPLEAR